MDIITNSSALSSDVWDKCELCSFPSVSPSNATWGNDKFSFPFDEFLLRLRMLSKEWLRFLWIALITETKNNKSIFPVKKQGLKHNAIKKLDFSNDYTCRLMY